MVLNLLENKFYFQLIIGNKVEFERVTKPHTPQILHDLCFSNYNVSFLRWAIVQLTRALISIYIDKDVCDISQVVVARYLQQCAVLNVFQKRFSSGDICIISMRLTHTAVHELHALTVCRRNVIENKRQHLVVKMKDLPEKDLQSK